MIGSTPACMRFIPSSMLLLSLVLGTTAWAQDSSAPLRQVRVLETSDYFDRRDLADELEQAGLAFPPGAGTLLIVDEATPGASTLVIVEPGTDPENPINETLDVVPVNVAFDSKVESERLPGEVGLVVFEAATQDLMTIKTGPDGELDPREMTSIETESFDVGTPRGTTLDPASGRIFILDGARPRIVATESEDDGNRGFSSIPLVLSSTDLLGLAFNPANGHLYILSATAQLIYEVTQSGELVATYDLSGFEEIDPIGMVFAPSGDRSDAPSVMNLFMASTRIGTRGTEPVVIEWSFTPLPQRSVGLEELPVRARLVASAAEPPVALAVETGDLVNTIDGPSLSPPSPDTAGIAFLDRPGTSNDALLFSDSEVNEIGSLFDGVNLWKIDFDGTQPGIFDTYDTTAASPDDSVEPTGVAYDPVRNVVFISDDTADEIFELTPGDDGVFFSGDNETFTSVIDTRLFSPSSTDPEGVAFDTDQGVLFIADGVNSEVYRVDPGAGGVFGDGNDVETNFDTGVLGISDPEGITYDTVNPGHLYVQGAPDDTVDHVTTAGSFVRDIDTSAADPRLPAGLALAPGSINPGDMNLYIAERGVDNDFDPNENDGAIYEFFIPPLNGGGPLPPTIDAGLDQTITLPDINAQLDGAVTDDGLPNPPGAVTTTWSGPPGVGFADPEAIDTTATFPGVGSFVLQLEADDGLFMVTDTVTITVEATANQPPAVSITAPTDGSGFTAGDSIAFTGTASDPEDGNLTGSLAWNSDRDGPIGSGGSFSTTTLSVGTHSIAATVTDSGALQGSASITVTVTPMGGITSVDIRIASSSDDAEEHASGSVLLTSSDLEFTFDRGVDQAAVGMRFGGVAVPQGATIVNASIQFQVDEVNTGATSLSIQGEDIDNATTFSTANGSISARPRTAASVAWSPAPWPTRNVAGPDQLTPNIASVVQEIVNRSGWTSGNSLAIIITGSGERTAESFDGAANAAPLLHIEYSTSGNQPPTVSISAPTDGSSFTVGDAITFTGTASDPEDGNLTGSLAWSSNLDGSIGSGGSFSTATLSAGMHTIAAAATDSGAFQGSDTITVTVMPSGGTVTVDIRVAASSDDAEERASGSVSLTSSDLEFVSDGGGNQTVGMRFAGVGVPQGATIVNAYIQFQVDEVNSGTTTLTIEGQNVNNAATFTSASNSISSRARTAASAGWAPVPWTIQGAAGPDQRTPNIATIIQQIVGRTGWSSGNALAIIVTGTGERTAESFNGAQGAAPLLHIEYSTSGNQRPAVSISAPPGGSSFTVGDSITFSGTANDSEDGNLAGSLSWSSNLDGVIGSGGSFSTTTLSVGAHTISAAATDSGAFQGSDAITVTVNPVGGPTTVDIRVAASSDDAEENAGSGTVGLTSSDLELVDTGGGQLVGMRFNGVTIPQGGLIINAYVQFQADETASGATSLIITGQAADSAPAFSSSSGNISARLPTSANVAWSPVPWTTVGEAGDGQQTPDLATVIQEIIDRGGWSSGNALAIIITGSGRRTAESFNGLPSGAPLLHVEYQ